MLHAAFSWVGYLILITVADCIPKDSLFSPLVRLASMVFMMLAILAMYGSIPRSMRLAKSLIALLAFAGIFFQIVAVADLYDIQPEVSGFFSTLVKSQFLFALALFPFAYCLWHHPLFPRWLGPAMVADGTFWLFYYWSISHHMPDSPWYLLYAVPFICIELTTGVMFVRNGLKLQDLSRINPQKSHPTP